MLAITPRTATFFRIKPKRIPRQLSRDRRKHLIETAAAILQQGHPTHFAYEGATTHGLRSSLCLQGWPWLDADTAAKDVVDAALRQIGAVRPTWQQGQISYTEESTIDHTRCANEDCGRPVAIGDNGRWRKYCSSECMSRHHAKMADRFGFRRTRAEYLAFHAANREKRKQATAQRDCAWCGRMFLHLDRRSEPQAYCCDACRKAAVSAALRKLAEKACARCGTMFRPKYAKAKFCGKECMALAFSRPVKPCEACGNLFRPKFKNDERFCGPTCRHGSYSRKPSGFRCEAAE
ncbi:hypothetical protein [Mesorhizobium sp.]|uniref:hypothetical protein n=1 Tax=Mesorhizobium sp. TaxID=1871066 RepID=UPI000FE34E5A|nr:hypothetical protein [Mesorhizobium sp.]RWK06522.1 MAG: hypothetical protein EOR42_10815 [Mesorhizobium sp.]